MGLFAIATFSGINLAKSKNNNAQQVKADADTYWASVDADSLNAQQLQTKIAGIIHNSPTTKITYDDLWTAYATSDVVPGKSNKIWDMYGGFQFTYITDQAGNYSKEGDVYNREHSIPKSWWGKTEDMRYSDLIHLVPTDGYVNNIRGNYAFGEVSSSSYSYKLESRTDGYGNVIQNVGYSKLGTGKAIDGKTAPTTVFEPDDQYKGDFARIYYYFATRYGVNNLLATSGDGGKMFSTSTDDYLTPYGRALLNKWHVQDPVSEKETTRNDAVQTIQKNRNPFVDHPEWADKIFGSNYQETHGGGSTEPYIRLTATDTSMEVGDSITLTAEVVNTTGNTISWYVEDYSTDVVTLSATSGATITINGVGAGNKNIFAYWGTLSKSVNIVVTEQGGGGGDTPEEGAYTRLTSIADIDSSAKYVLGIDGTGFHYSGTSDWGSIALPSAQTPIYYTLTKNVGNTSFTAKATINNTVYYLTVPTSNTFTMSTSSTNIKLGTTATATGDTSYAVTNVSSTARHIRVNGNSGLRAYGGSTGSMAYFYKVDETLNSISVKTDPTKVNYTEGEYFDPTGLVINLNYSSGSTELAYAGHSSDFTFNPSTSTPLDADDEVIEITYGGKTCYLTIEVTEPSTLASISLSGQTTTYYVGDTFSFDGVVTAHYENGSSATVTPTSVTSPNMSTAGTKSVTVSYTESNVTKTASYDITVSEVVLSSIEITTPPTKTTYYVGDTFSSAGLVVTATYSNSSTSTVTPTAISSPDMSTTGTKTITVTYTENNVTKTATFDITVSVEPTPSAEDVIDLTAQGYGNQQVVTSVDGENCTVTFDKGSNNNSPKYFTSGAAVRCYGGNTFTVTSSSSNIISITLTFSTGEDTNAITTNTGTFSSPTWTGNASSVTFTIGGTSGHRRISKIAVTYEQSPVGPTLQSISLNTDNVKKSFIVNDVFVYTGLVVTANYSDGTHPTIESGYSVSTPNMSTAGDKTVTVSYGGKEAEYTINVASAPATSITAVSNKTSFYVGETITKANLTVTTNNGDDVTTLVTFNDYQFNYSDSNGGGSPKNKTFIITYNSLETTLTVQVSRKAYVAPTGTITDKLTLADTGASGTTYSSWNGVTKNSDATYAGQNAGGNDAIQLRTTSPAGMVQTTSGGCVTSISVEWNTNTVNGRSLVIYGKNTAYTSSSDLYNNSTKGTNLGTIAKGTTSFTLTGEYEYIGVIASGGALYLDSISFNYESTETPTNLSNYIMYEDTPNQCETKFDIATGYFGNLTKEERSTFMTSNDYVIATARERLQAWAKYHGKQIAYQDEDYIIKDARVINPIVNNENSSAIAIVVIFGLIGVTSIAGYFFIRKRKED